MKILYFTKGYTTHDHRFLSALAKTDNEIYYLRLENRGHSLEDRAVPQEVQTVRWAGGREPFTWGALPRLLQDLRRVIGEIKPDLTHAGPLQTAAFLVALAGFRPLVSVSWGYDLIIDAHQNSLYRWITRFVLGRSAAMVGDSRIIRRLAVSFGMPDERIVTFPWGVDLEAFCPDSNWNPYPSTFNLLSTRGWEPVYGVDVIARAFVEAAQQLPEIRLVMLGNGSQAGMLRDIFQRGGVSDRVFFPGHASQADLPRYYRAADLYVSASHSDGTSISLLEALACGRPVLVSDIPGNLEWITPGKEGWLFPDGDARALAEGIANAVIERKKLPEMGQAARRLAEEKADWQKNFPVLFQAYDLALKTKAEAPH